MGPRAPATCRWHRQAGAAGPGLGILICEVAPASHPESRQAAWGRVSRNNSPEAQRRLGLCPSSSRPQACHQLWSRCHCVEQLSPQQSREGARG